MAGTRLVLGVGSNYRHEQNLQRALRFLSSLMSGLQCSPVYSSEVVGGYGDRFYNLVVSGFTTSELVQINRVIKEFESGYERRQVPHLVLPIDIDLLLFGDFVGLYEGGTLPRSDVETMPYVLKPLADLVPQELHPVTQLTFVDMWGEMSKRPGIPAVSPVTVAPLLAVTHLDTLCDLPCRHDLDANFDLGKRLRDLRRRKQMSLRDVAIAADVTHSSISVIENNLASPAVKTLERILGAYSLTLSEFFTGCESSSEYDLEVG